MGTKLTEEQILTIHQRWMNGELKRDLSKEFNVSEKTLYSSFRKFSLPSRKRKNPNCDKLTYNLEDAHIRYCNGESTSKIAEDCGITSHALVTRFHKRGLFTFPDYRRSKSVQSSKKFNPVNSQEAAYWLGFLVADGCLLTHVGKNRTTYSISVTCSKKDLSHMELFSEYIDGKIYSYNESIVCVKSKVSTDWICLKDYGFINKKASRLVWPKLDNNLYRFFVLGFLDGDGTVWSHPTGKTEIEGSVSFYSVCDSFLKSIQEWLSKNQIKSSIYIQKQKEPRFIADREIQGSEILKLMIFRKEDLKNLFYLLYKDSPVFLQRKRDKLLSILKDITPW